MPVPGPRTQFAPLPGYSNPGQEEPTRLNRWKRPAPIAKDGQTPGLMEQTLRGETLAAGQIRQLYRQTVNYIAAQAPYSWTASSPMPNRAMMPIGGYYISRALRYLTRSLYVAGGTDNTRYAGLHTEIKVATQRSAESRGRRVTVAAGSVRSRPTVRNRLISFGQRVPTINKPSPAAQGPNPES